jgi:two-component system KDP operon response regulator KdpE
MNTAMPQRVLVVDDEQATRHFLRNSLRTEGYEVIEEDAGEDALVEIRRRMPDLVVLDLKLPGIDGSEVIRRVRHEGSYVPIIVLTSRTDEAGKVEALDLGADDYITKPFGIANCWRACGPRCGTGSNRKVNGRYSVVVI